MIENIKIFNSPDICWPNINLFKNEVICFRVIPLDHHDGGETE